jgi:hypothetical protein
MEVTWPDTFLIACLVITLGYYILAECMDYAQRQVRRTEEDHITFKKCLEYLDEMIPGPVFPAAVTVSKPPTVSDLRTDEFIGNCATCLAPAAARCSGCKSVPYW